MKAKKIIGFATAAFMAIAPIMTNAATEDTYQRDVREIQCKTLDMPQVIPENIGYKIRLEPDTHPFIEKKFGTIDIYSQENFSGDLDLYPVMLPDTAKTWPATIGYNVTVTDFDRTNIESLYTYPFVNGYDVRYHTTPETYFLQEDLIYPIFKNYAFCYSPKLKKITLSTRELFEGVFCNCPELEYADLNPSTFVYGYVHEYYDDFWGLNQYIEKDTLLVRQIHKIGNKTFADCPKLKWVFVDPDSLENIGQEAFANCTSLKLRTMRNAVIDKSAFSNCISLDTVEVCAAFENAFNGCTNLKVAEIYDPSNRFSLDDMAFNDCISLDSIRITKNKFNPKNHNFCTGSPFKGCTNLRAIVLRTDSEYDYWQYHQDSIIPTRFPKIPAGAFADSPNIKSIYICPDQATRTSEYILPEIEEGAFPNYNATLYIYSKMKPLVEAHPVWSKFTKIVEIEREIIDDGLSSVSVAEDNDIKIWAENGAVRIQNATNEQLRAQIYLISGQTIYDGTEQTIKLPKGLYIVKVGNKTEKIQVQ